MADVTRLIKSMVGNELFVVPLDYMLYVNNMYSVWGLCVTGRVIGYGPMVIPDIVNVKLVFCPSLILDTSLTSTGTDTSGGPAGRDQIFL